MIIRSHSNTARPARLPATTTRETQSVLGAQGDQTSAMIERKIFSWSSKYQKLNNEIKLNNAGDKKLDNSKTNSNINFIKNINSNKVIEAKTLSSSWFCPKMSRFQSENFLKNSPVGSFVVRSSTSLDSSYVLSLRAPGVTVQHHLISTSENQVRISGSTKHFSSIFSLVTHLSIMKENLPCRLSVSSLDSETSDTEDQEEDRLTDLDSEPEMEEVVMQLKKFLSVQ